MSSPSPHRPESAGSGLSPADALAASGGEVRNPSGEAPGEDPAERPGPAASLASQPLAGPASQPLGGSSRKTYVNYLVLVWLCLAATVAYMSRNAISAAESTIRTELELNVQQMAWVLSAFFWGYALAQIPTGALGQAWGTRRALTLYAIVWSLATALLGLATGFLSLLVLRLLFGIAQAGIFPCAANTIARWLPTSRRAIGSGALGSFMSIGGAVGVALTGALMKGIAFDVGGGEAWVLVPGLSWRTVFLLLALPGLLWAVGFYWWFRDRPEDHRAVGSWELALLQRDKPPPSPHRRTPWGRILNHPDMWLVCGQQFFRAAAYVIFVTWFPTYLQESWEASTAEAGLLTAVPLLSFVIGGLLGGVVVDTLWHLTRSRRVSRQAVGVVAMFGCSLFLLAAYGAASTYAVISLVSVGSLFAALAGSCGYTLTIDKSGDYVGPVFGAMNMSGNFGAALCPIVIAYVVRNTGDVRTGTANWDSVLLVFMAITLAAGVCWLLVNPNGTFFDDPRQER